MTHTHEEFSRRFGDGFGRRGGPQMGPFGTRRGGRSQMRNAPFQMWVAKDEGGHDAERGGEHHDRHEDSERGRGGRGRGGPGSGRGGPFGRGRGDGSGRQGFGPGGFGPSGFGPGGFGPGGLGPNGDFGRGRGRGGRGRRGDVSAAVLLLLEMEPMHGYELIQQIADKSNGTWKPSPGSIYPALSQLEDEGLVIIDKVAGRKTASLTAEGRAHVEEHRSDLGSPWDDVSNSVGGDARDLRGLIGQLMGAAAQVAGVGTAKQVQQAAEVLAEARRTLYRILAEDTARPDQQGADGPATPEEK